MFTSLFYITSPLAQQTRKTKAPAFLFVCDWEVEEEDTPEKWGEIRIPHTVATSNMEACNRAW